MGQSLDAGSELLLKDPGVTRGRPRRLVPRSDTGRAKEAERTPRATLPYCTSSAKGLRSLPLSRPARPLPTQLPHLTAELRNKGHSYQSTMRLRADYTSQKPVRAFPVPPCGCPVSAGDAHAVSARESERFFQNLTRIKPGSSLVANRGRKVENNTRV